MKKILVIEDDPAVRDSILDILDAENFYTCGAENGRLGVEALDEFHPDLILCDVMMPELDGYKVLEQVRKNLTTATIPFLFLTAKVEKNDLRQGMIAGADDYLTKPFTRGELLQAITTRFDKQTTIDQHTQAKLNNLRQNISLSIPHELNTALNVISGLTSILVDDYETIEPPELLELAESIQLGTQRLHRLVYNSLLVVKLELLATNPEQVAMLHNHWLEDADVIITETALQKALQYKRSEDLSLELAMGKVRISEWKLRKIVEELLDNAFKFSQPGSVVRVFTSTHNQQFVMHVIDYGHGMTAEHIANIGAYMQFDRSTQEQQGVGLGIEIVNRLVQLYDGFLSIESIPGQQTIVRVALPA